ncbi:MAG: hypothetical protein CMJ83_10585 [Planctomycetes bacterium]|nr:hypothetical protein [Planctomycetota bacterium]
MGFVLLALIVCPAGGTTLIKKDLGQLAREAEAVVLAVVLQNRCQWNADHTLIWTTTTLRVTETWKGKVPAKLSLMEPGGVMPPVGQWVPGMARYQPGETVVVFLKKDVLGQWRTHGCAQGRFHVDTRSDGRMSPRFGPWTRHVVKRWFQPGGKVPAPDLATFKTRVTALAAKPVRRGK